MADLSEQKHDALRYLYKLCYRVIEQAQNNYRKNQVSEYKVCCLYWIKIFKSQNLGEF